MHPLVPNGEGIHPNPHQKPQKFMSEITYDEIRDCNETVEVNAKALLRAHRDGAFRNLGNAHQRAAKSSLRESAQNLVK